MKKNHPLLQFIRFNLVGVLNTAVDFLVFLLLNGALRVHYMPAKVLSYGCGLLNSYFFNSRWTFRAAEGRKFRHKFLFVLVNLVALGTSLGIMWLCHNVFRVGDHWGISRDIWANVIATPIAMVVNFTGNRLFVFKD